MYLYFGSMSITLIYGISDTPSTRTVMMMQLPRDSKGSIRGAFPVTTQLLNYRIIRKWLRVMVLMPDVLVSPIDVQTIERRHMQPHHQAKSY